MSGSLIRLPALRILDFDIENRPLTYMGNDYTSPDVTAIAAKFADEATTYCWLLGRDSREDILDGFAALYAEADIVTGHNILGHDLPIVSGALVELGRQPLVAKMVSDTYYHLRRFRGVSKSQENLGALFGLDAPKVQMNQVKWREANRLTEGGLSLTEARVVGDVVQHEALRAELIRRDLLKAPRPWRGA